MSMLARRLPITVEIVWLEFLVYVLCICMWSKAVLILYNQYNTYFMMRLNIESQFLVAYVLFSMLAIFVLTGFSPSNIEELKQSFRAACQEQGKHIQ